MRLGKHAIPATSAVLLAFLAACSSGGSDSESNTIATALQDLDADPSGATVVITFERAQGLSGATTANFEADDGQIATAVDVDGDVVTVTWDTYVPPSSRVRAIGLGDVASAFVAVTTSDAAAPTFAITDGIQNDGLGGDVIEVTFAGAHVLAAEVEALDTWTLSIDGVDLDLTGSTFDFDSDAQVLSITLGSLANLHATFELAASGLSAVNDATVSSTPVDGAAAGDAIAPTLLAAEQNLDEDEFGRVVDFTFSEAMDPVFAAQVTRFSIDLPGVATSVEQPSEDVLRVTFSAPVVPGADDVDFADLVDAHGNALPDGFTAVTQPAPVANDYDGTPEATTVADVGGDTFTVVTTQALDPDTAVLPDSWELEIDGAPVALEDQLLTYDLLTKTLTIDLDFDLVNGDAFEITGIAALDVDGETFSETAAGVAAGDATLPTIVSIVQNRNIDSSGSTVDVQFSEDLSEAAAETLVNYDIGGTPGLSSATLLNSLDTVRLVYDDYVVPGDATFTIADVADLAGNAMAAVAGVALTSTDTTGPAPVAADGRALAGADNDTLAVRFNDDVIASEVEDPANWTFESPVGTSVSTVGATVSYDEDSRVATLTFENGFDLQRGDDFEIAFTTLRDIAGNTVTAATLSGEVAAETDLPEVHTVYRESSVANELVVRFTEPCAAVDDLHDAVLNPTGARYVLRDSGGLQRGTPTTATEQDDGLGVRLTFGVVIAASDTLDVLGLVDRCGNPLFPALAVATVAEDTTTPALDTGLSTFAIEYDENNDTITVVFDRPMSPWDLTTPGRFEATGPDGDVDLSGSHYAFDGLDTVTIGLRAGDGNDLVEAGGYTLSVNDVWSAQGTQRTVADSEAGIVASGDAVAPTAGVNDVRLDPADANSLLITLDEAVDATVAAVAANYDLNAGTLATSAERIGLHVVRATFGVAPTPGDTLTFSVEDLAGNSSGAIARTVTAADSAAPLVVAVTGTIVPGYGGDFVTVSFDEPLTSTAVLASNWSVSSNGSALSLAGVRITYVARDNVVHIALAGGSDLDANGNVSVTLTNMTDHAGNVLVGPVTVFGTVSGDTTPPAEANAFVNWREDAGGTVIDVLFDEDVDASVAAVAGNWTATGGPTVSAVEMLERDHYRLTLSATLADAATVGITGLEDPARNAAGALSFDPVE